MLLAAACLAAVGQSAAGFAAEAGKFQFVAGEVKIVNPAGMQRVPVKGEAFSAGDTIVTGVTGSAQIRMSDGGLVAVRPETEMKLDQYVFNGREDGSERKVVSLIKGGFRAITGLIGKRNKDNYRILTPSATIGIRGTDHEPVVVPAGAKGGFQAGTYDRVYRGAAIIETDKGKLIVNPNQVGFTPGKGVTPVLLPKIPDFYNARPGAPDAARDPQKESRPDDGGSNEKNADTSARGTTVKSLSTLKSDGTSVTDSLKDVDTSATRLTSPLDSSSVKTLKSDVLTTPLSDTSLKSTLETSTLKDTSTLKSDALTTPVTVPTTTLRSTDVLTAPTTTTTSTLKSTTTTVTAPVTTVAPTSTTISPKLTEPVTAPTTTIRSTITR
ncbi:MAG TPA: FecR family protein [Burkholderiales bacterium]|nr:FecR family protein [Burkholderiales bacterium]